MGDIEDRIERLENELDRLKRAHKQEHVDRIKSDNDDQDETSVDRRTFLKGLAGGAAGLSALGALQNAAAFDIKSPWNLSYFGGNNTATDFEVDTQGVLTTNQIGSPSNKISTVFTEQVNDSTAVGMPGGVNLQGSGSITNATSVGARTGFNGTHKYPSTTAELKSDIEIASSGDVIHVTDGLEIDSTITITTGGIKIVGGSANVESWRQEGVWLNSTITDGSHVFEFDSSGGQLSAVRMEGFAVAGTGSEGDGIHFKPSSNEYTQFIFDNVRIADVGGRGFYFNSIYGSQFYQLRAQGCGGPGIYLHDNGNHQSHNLKFFNPWVGQCDSTNVDAQVKSDWSTAGAAVFFGIHWYAPLIDGVLHDGTATTGMRLAGGYDNSIIYGNHENPNGGTCIHIDSALADGKSGGYRIYGGRIQGGDIGVDIDGADSVLVDEVWMDGTTTDIRLNSGGRNKLGLPNSTVGGKQLFNVNVASTWYDMPLGMIATSGGNNLPSGDIRGRLGYSDAHGTTMWYDGSHWRPLDSFTGTYTGDGTTGRTISLNCRPHRVVVQGSDGTVYDVSENLSGNPFGSTPTGELSIANTGFTVGDDGADANPNTDGESYSYWVQ